MQVHRRRTAVAFGAGPWESARSGEWSDVAVFLLGCVMKSARPFELTPPDAPGGWIGSDEAGKGDYFGPLVVAGVYATEQTAILLRQIGVRDSKTLSDKRITVMSAEIRDVCLVNVVAIGPERYNQLYAKIRNLNRFLAWAHARVIENLLEKVTCERAVSDQFGDEQYLQRALMGKGKHIQLVQRHRAEDDLAVGAASIIARGEFVRRLQQLSQAVGVELAKGAGAPVLVSARRFVEQHGRDALSTVAKLHFRTTQQILG
jgi:ribonuclease HIII